MVFISKPIQVKIRLYNLMTQTTKAFQCKLCNSEYEYHLDMLKHFDNHEDAEILLGILDNTPRSEWEEEIQSNA